MNSLERQSVIQFNHVSPLYEQVKQSLLHDIMNETYTYGDRLPSEAELSEQYGVSRITIRRTISELAEEGYLSSQQGRGTFVKYHAKTQELRAFNNFEDGNAHHLERKILSKECIEADAGLAEIFEILPGARIVKLRRLFTEAGKEYSIDNAYFPETLYPGIFEKLQDNVSTLDLVKNFYKMNFYKAYKTLGVIRAGDTEAALLKCVPGEPLFSITKVYYDRMDKPVHYSQYLILGTRCKYTLTVNNDEADTKVLFQGE
ncbi:GntR family transcriptional regulator [Breznakiella homolactica]|uniref:GntR family transcriptional regulator n=1 Tax=Breznakiella homolactica TaxID=2798577 RepID=A0A7T7XJ94_9SPIR|nr:GntR family transcriptional regulator [Breznakiella homolactica]QQO07391.1 GntR family transcriptional regulator [Breznakiella homolactica]